MPTTHILRQCEYLCRVSAAAVEAFQCDHNLLVDGDPGPNTQTKLLELHGC